MMSDFASEVAKYPQNPQIAQNRELKNDARYTQNFIALCGVAEQVSDVRFCAGTS